MILEEGENVSNLFFQRQILTVKEWFMVLGHSKGHQL